MKQVGLLLLMVTVLTGTGIVVLHIHQEQLVTQNAAELPGAVHQITPTQPTQRVPTPTINALYQTSTSPTITINTPADGSLLPKNSTVIITTETTSGQPISSVTISVNNKVICVKRTAPYSCSWLVPSQSGSTYTIQATAVDMDNNTATAFTHINSLD